MGYLPFFFILRVSRMIAVEVAIIFDFHTAFLHSPQKFANIFANKRGLITTYISKGKLTKKTQTTENQLGKLNRVNPG